MVSMTGVTQFERMAKLNPAERVVVSYNRRDFSCTRSVWKTPWLSDWRRDGAGSVDSKPFGLGFSSIVVRW